MESIVIVSGARTGIGSFGGSLKQYQATDLGGFAIKAAVERAGIKPEDVDEVVMGCVGQAAENAFMARVSSIKAGIPYEASALTVNRLCSSGLQAIYTAALEIDNGFCDIAVAGGGESMSNIPFYLRNARFGYRMGHNELEDGLITALSDPITRDHMGITAENVAEKYNITREDQDAYAVLSQTRAAKAKAEGKFADEIVPVEVKVNKKETRMFAEDEYIRPDSSVEKLAKLRPAFKKDGTVTAGNASGINDAGAAVVVMKESEAKKRGIAPIVRIVDAAVAGVDPAYIVSLVNVVIITLAGKGFSVPAAAFTALAVAVACGMVNGVIIGIFRVNPLLTTFATSTIFAGIALWILPNPGGSVDYSFAEWYMGNQLGFILTPVALILLLCLIWFVAIKTPFGLKLYALGCDEKKAYASGVKVGTIRFLVHTYAGLAAGIAGICITANICSGSPTIGASMSLNSIAAAVIGGISLNGGIGTIGGGLLGAAFLSILTNIVVAAKLSSYVQSFVQGLILLIGVILSIVAGDKEIKSKFRRLFRKGAA